MISGTSVLSTQIKWPYQHAQVKRGFYFIQLINPLRERLLYSCSELMTPLHGFSMLQFMQTSKRLSFCSPLLVKRSSCVSWRLGSFRLLSNPFLCMQCVAVIEPEVAAAFADPSACHAPESIGLASGGCVKPSDTLA